MKFISKNKKKLEIKFDFHQKEILIRIKIIIR